MLDLQGLTVKDMEELHDDIKVHLDMDRATRIHTQYWEVISVLCAGCVSETNTVLFMIFFNIAKFMLLFHPC